MRNKKNGVIYKGCFIPIGGGQNLSKSKKFMRDGMDGISVPYSPIITMQELQYMLKIMVLGYVWKSQQNGAVYDLGGAIALP